MVLIFMESIRNKFNLAKSQVNYVCITLEGLFNVLGGDIIGMATIVPLFLREYGASMTLIGAMPTIHSIVAALTPLVAGNFIATAKKKKRISLIFNGYGRSSMLIIPLMLMLGVADQTIVTIFFVIITLYYVCQSITGITWNYLLGACVQPWQRGKLLGNLFAMSGVISFFSANIVRILRENPALMPGQRYSAIFGLGGLLLTISVLFFIPLKEDVPVEKKKDERNLRFYVNSLRHCLKNVHFRRLIYTQACSHICMAVNTFIYVFSDEHLMLATHWISYMIIIQTIGVVCGGLVTGRISTNFGTKRTIVLAEIIAVIIPVLQIIALIAKPVGLPSPIGPGLLLATAFLMGFNRSGQMAFQSHMLEVAGEENAVYYIVTRSTLLLPISFVSILIGMYFDRFPHFLEPVYIMQIIVAAAALYFATRLRLLIYPKGEKKET